MGEFLLSRLKGMLTQISISSIRIWNFIGDAITELDGHDSFIYALVSIPALSGGGMASAGEDGIVRIWNEGEGELEQEILVPALSGACLRPFGVPGCVELIGVVLKFGPSLRSRVGIWLSRAQII